MTELSDKLSPKQKKLILMAAQAANYIVNTFSMVADSYRNGETLGQIMVGYNLPHILEKEFNLNADGVKVALKYALKELIPNEELKQIAHQHKVNAGNRLVRLKLGVHSDSYDGRKNGDRLTRLRGQVPWVNGDLIPEIVYADKLAKIYGYRRNFSKLAAVLNSKYHNGVSVRNPSSVAQALTDYRKQSKNNGSKE